MKCLNKYEAYYPFPHTLRKYAYRIPNVQISMKFRQIKTIRQPHDRATSRILFERATNLRLGLKYQDKPSTLGPETFEADFGQ